LDWIGLDWIGLDWIGLDWCLPVFFGVLILFKNIFYLKGLRFLIV